MVLTIPASDLKGALYKNRVAEINKRLTVTDTARNRIGTNQIAVPLPAGLLHFISFGNIDKSGTVLNKGETYISGVLQKSNPTDQPTKIPLVQDYLYDAFNPSWAGEIPVEDGDLIFINYWNSSVNITAILVSGLVIKL